MAGWMATFTIRAPLDFVQLASPVAAPTPSSAPAPALARRNSRRVSSIRHPPWPKSTEGYALRNVPARPCVSEARAAGVEREAAGGRGTVVAPVAQRCRERQRGV